MSDFKLNDLSSLPRFGRRFVGVGMLTLACALPAHAGLFSDDEARAQVAKLRTQLDDVTRRVDSATQNQVEFSNQTESIKADIAKLRGQIDELTYNLDAVQKRQKDFYVDLDNRLRKIESQGQADSAQTQNPADAKGEAARADEASAMRDYEAALTALKTSDFKKAVSGFESFIKNAPDSPQQPAAYFFAGYCYSHLKQPAKAAEMYRYVAEKWPNDEHAPDAMLARADIMEAAGQHKDARFVLVTLTAKYPASDAAKQAKLKLNKKK